MRYLKSILLLISIPFILAGNPGLTLYGDAAVSHFPGAKMVYISQPSGLMKYVQLGEDQSVSIYDGSYWLSRQLGHSAGYSYQPAGQAMENANEWVQRFYLHVNGAKVHDGMVILHGKDGQMTTVNGNLYTSILFQNSPKLSESDALRIALSNISAKIYRWELPAEELHLKWETGDPEATYFPKGEKVLFPVYSDEDVAHAYSWMFKIYTTEPLAIKEVIVDAGSGEIIQVLDLLMHVDVPGTAVTKYSGVLNIITDSTGVTYRLRETGRGNGIETYNMLNGTNYGNSVDFTDADNYWNNFNAQKDEIATDAHWGAEMTYDYFWLEHGRNSIDNNGFMLRSYVHYDLNYANAFWDGYRMTYGDGSGSMGPLTAVDIIAHEISHGLTSYTADLDYSYESGALNEAFSDIFGTCVEFYAKPTAANWTLGENIGSTFRSLSNPNAYGDPDTYLGNNWYTGSGDNGGVHTNSGVLNFWFYLLTVGGNGMNDIGSTYSVNGIGIDKAANIAFRTLTVYLTNTSQYADARFYAILSAVDLYGPCSPEVAATTNAMHAIGVGPAYYNGVLSNFSSSATTNCSVPVSVPFTNTSVNGMTYLWDFGDGNTSTSLHPVHTYTAPGIYDVKLYVDGGVCGTDTMIKLDFIDISTPPAPFVSGLGYCGAGAVILTAIATDTVRWYDAPTGGNLLHVGPVFTTPFLTQSTPYYVVNSQEIPPIHGGKLDNTGPGSYFTSNGVHYLEFNTTAAVFLKSVKVYAGSAGNRTIELRSSSGNLLQSVSVAVASGQSRIDLNFSIPAGNGYQLAGPNYPDLFRNSGGTSYPYTVGPYVTITKSSAWTNPTGYYYYFYDWELQETPCVSQRIQAMAAINSDVPMADFTFSQVGDLALFQNQSIQGNVFSWDFGDGNSSYLVSPEHTYSTTGNYTVNLIASNGCGSDSIQYQVPVVITGQDEQQALSDVLIYPNPTRDLLFFYLPKTWMDLMDYRVSDLTGREIHRGAWNSSLGHVIGLNIQDWNPGVYVVEMRHNTSFRSMKVVIAR